MSSLNATLRECHRLRVHIRDLLAEIDRGPRVLKARQDDLEAARAEHAEHYEAVKRLKLKQRDDEGTLKQTETRLAKLEAQLIDLAVAKERAAKESEIAQARAKKAELEDAILATIMELEEKTAAVPAVEQKWADAQTEFAEFQTEAAERLERMRRDLDESRAALEQRDAELPDAAKRTYDTVVRAKGPDALAGAKARVCQACRATMTETQYANLRGGEFRTCSACGRVLYAAE